VIAAGRLFTIETRRNIGFWAFPFLAGLAWLAWRINQGAEPHSSVALWPQTSIDIAFAVAFVGPAAGGLAAWVAGRDRRRGMDDLLATTPLPVSRRELTLLAATTLWVLCAYLAAGTYQGINTARGHLGQSCLAPNPHRGAGDRGTSGDRLCRGHLRRLLADEPSDRGDRPNCALFCPIVPDYDPWRRRHARAD